MPCVELGFDLPISVESAFRFFSDPRNLDRVTPHWFTLGFVDAPPQSLASGATIDYHLRWRRLPLTWRSVITEWQPPTLFTYTQGRGPYRHFRHEHLFHPAPDGVRVEDRIDFRLAGPRLLEKFVATELERILRFRANESARLLRGGGDPEPR